MFLKQTSVIFINCYLMYINLYLSFEIMKAYILNNKILKLIRNQLVICDFMEIILLSNYTRRSYMYVFALVIFPYKANFVSSCPSQKRWQPFRTKAYCIKIWLFKALTNFMALLQWYFLVIVIIEPKILRHLMTRNTLMPGYISFCVYDLFHNILFLF